MIKIANDINITDYHSYFMGFFGSCVGLIITNDHDDELAFQKIVEDDERWYLSTNRVSSRWWTDQQLVINCATNWLNDNCLRIMGGGWLKVSRFMHWHKEVESTIVPVNGDWYKLVEFTQKHMPLEVRVSKARTEAYLWCQRTFGAAIKSDFSVSSFWACYRSTNYMKPSESENVFCFRREPDALMCKMKWG